MPRYLRNSRYNKVFLLIGIGAVVFISFQILSLRVLSKTAREQSRTLIEDLEGGNLEDTKKKRDVYKEEGIGNLPNGENAMNKQGQKSLASQNKYNVRGVSPEELDLYVPNKNNKFICLHSKKRIQFTEVNDDYCDCDDNSDEPGTSACDGRFYCKRQFPNQALIKFPSNRVNDGICDCCDGSDEWKNVALPSGVIPDNHAKLSVKYAPCEDHCDKLIKAKEEDKNIQIMGRRLKQSYIKSARHLTHKEDYGPDGVFYKLSQSCFWYKTKEYEYQVCPFKKVIQEHFPSAPFNLGRVSEWVHKKNGRYILRIDGGDTHLCPDGLGRRSFITFLCGLHDRVISLQEDEKCAYGIRFSTPAAC